MATKTFRGKAQVSGCEAALDIITYAAQQSIKITQEADEEIIKDPAGQDAAWRAQNEKYMGDIAMKILGSNAAAAQARAILQAPYTTITISGSDSAAVNGAWQNLPAGDISLQNDKTGDQTYKLRRYTDSVQNTLATTTPS